MADLPAQLRAYAATVLDPVEEVGATEILQRSARPAHPRRWRAALVGGVTVALVAAVAIGTATLKSRSSPRITSGALPTTWSRLDTLQDAPFITAMASRGHGVVAAGEGIWYSRDAGSWTQVLDPSALSGGRNGSRSLAGLLGQLGQLTDVIVGGPGYVAVGQADDPATQRAVAAVWTSTDGRRWVRAPSPALAPPTPPIPDGVETPVRGYIQSVSDGGPGLVAVGGVFGGAFSGGELVSQPYDPAVWTSPDGAHWSRVDTGSVFGSRTGISPLLSLSAVTEDGRQLVLAATNRDTTTIFESPDGSHWRRTASIPGTISQMTESRDRLVAVGSQRNAPGGTSQRGVVWTSTDAVHWRQAAVSAPAPFATYTGVASTGDSVVVVGYRGVGEPVEDGVMLVSADATRWVAVPEDGGPFAARTTLVGVTSTFGGRYLAFGNQTASGDGSAASPYRYRLGLYRSTSG
ncbi:MAG TPA: hypothetical protein VI462_14735 [Acidimicrobiia bacterium]